MPTKSNVFRDIILCTFVYGTSPTTITFLELEDVVHNFKGTEIFWSGAAAPGPTHKAVVDNRREATLMGADGKVLNSIPQGTYGTLTWVEGDWNNGVLAGATTYILTNFSFADTGGGGKHNEAKKYTAKGCSIWTLVSGSYIDPLSMSQA